MRFPREGFTIDYVAGILQRSVLNPFLTLPAALGIGIAGSSALLQPSSVSSILGSVYARNSVYCLAAASLLLWLNDRLNRGFANNWLSNPAWVPTEEIVVITGGSSGIGASIAQGLLSASPKTTIVIVDFAPMAWVAPPNSSVHYYQADVIDSAEIRDTCNRIRKDIGHPTVLVNNAGICRGSTVAEGPYSDVEATIRTNLTAPFLLAKEFLPEMVRRDHGHIVNISSMSSVTPPPRIADYSASKAGLIALHESLQVELKNIHSAPRVRLTLGVFGFVRTAIIKGETGQPNFIFPMMHPDTIGDKIVESITSGYGRTIYLPGAMRFVACLRGCPEWIHRIARQETAKLPIDFTGRHKIDPETSKLV